MEVTVIFADDHVQVYTDTGGVIRVRIPYPLPVYIDRIDHGMKSQQDGTEYVLTTDRPSVLPSLSHSTPEPTTPTQPVQADYLEEALRRYGPLTTPEWAQRATELGFTTATENLVDAVRKVAHRVGRFQRTPDGKRWWLKDVPIPPTDAPVQRMLVEETSVSTDDQGGGNTTDVERNGSE